MKDRSLLIWLFVVICILHISPDTAISLHRKTDRDIEAVERLLDDIKSDEKEIERKALPNKYVLQDGEKSNIEELAHEAVEERIEELINKFEASEKPSSERIAEKRLQKRGWWWLCPWCGDGSKFIDLIEAIIACDCISETNITCTCGDGKVLEF